MAEHQTTSGENQGTQLAQAGTSVPAGSEQGLKVTVAQCQADVLLNPPAAGERVVVKGEPGQSCCFDLASIEGSKVTLDGNTLTITLPGGGEIVLENFIPSAPGIQSLPSAKTALVASAEACVTTWVTARANRPAAAPTIAAAAAPLGKDGIDRLVFCAIASFSSD